MVSGNIRKWPAHVIDGLTFAMALFNHLCIFALLMLAQYGALIIVALHTGLIPKSEDIVSATPWILQAAACLTLLAWTVGFVIFGRSPFGRLLPNRWAAQLLNQPATKMAFQLRQVLAEAAHGDHPHLDGPVEHMHHWLKMREHPLSQCSMRELGAIMHEAQTQRDGRPCH